MSRPPMRKPTLRWVGEWAASVSPSSQAEDTYPMTTSKEIVRLKITLDDVKPTVMRRVEVPVSITLDRLHEIIQAIMPWENSHLHAFYLRLIDGPRWAPPSPFGDDFNFGIEARDSMRT